MSSISIFHTGFVICLAGAILFFVITAILFFVFDIRTIFSIRSGRAQAKTVKEMEMVNSSTGRLRANKKSRDTSQQKKKNKPAPDTSVSRAPVIQPPSVAENDTFYTKDDSLGVTEKLRRDEPSQEEDPYENTALLSGTGADETSVLNEGGETSVLSGAGDQTSHQAPSPVYFEVVKKIIRLDTDEVIG